MMPERKLNRLREYDYSKDGHYFVTICVKNRLECLGKIYNERMIPNENGKIVIKCWDDLPNHYHNIRLDGFIMMPNHVHAIIIIKNPIVGNGFKPFPTKKYNLSEIIRGFKTFSSRKINEQRNITDKFQWQKSFYDHIIRNEKSLNKIREYIQNNPLQWHLDVENNECFSHCDILANHDYYAEKITI
jgi:putative transposase